MRKSKVRYLFISVGILILYMAFFPSLSPELAVRKSLLLKHPVLAFTGEVSEGRIHNDPRYGDLYVVPKADLPFVYVKKNRLGWIAAPGGSGP
ncbi:hypothetical protein [Paenibacillus sp. P46E]|uniref:hypothetical protein n=1 Tax=Paenibacillus sp. P46E TaxID=1349436 RepID=UPI00093FE77D|nr:hypothetical protein [Paenibacillus sp. P46E]OKP95507.1 hypothetical protein A3849_25770 [Paenibacillus sp. P46E]